MFLSSNTLTVIKGNFMVVTVTTSLALQASGKAIVAPTACVM
jgi:hypothetical protein